MPEPTGCNFPWPQFLPQSVLRSILLAGCVGFVSVHGLCAVGRSYPSANDVTWTTLGVNENDSMPIGNGDLAANVWTEQNGDFVLLVAKSDAWTELGKLVKLGRIRIALAPNPFLGASDFTQTLRLEAGIRTTVCSTGPCWPPAISHSLIPPLCAKGLSWARMGGEIVKVL